MPRPLSFRTMKHQYSSSATLRVALRTPALLVRTANSARAYVWDLFLPLVLVLTLASGMLSFFLKPDIWPFIVALLVTKRAHVRVYADAVVITWWWAIVPYRERRLGPGGSFVDDGGDDCSDERPVTMLYEHEKNGEIWCPRPDIVTEFLNEHSRDLWTPPAFAEPRMGPYR